MRLYSRPGIFLVEFTSRKALLCGRVKVSCGFKRLGSLRRHSSLRRLMQELRLSNFCVSKEPLFADGSESRPLLNQNVPDQRYWVLVQNARDSSTSDEAQPLRRYGNSTSDFDGTAKQRHQNGLIPLPTQHPSQPYGSY